MITAATSACLFSSTVPCAAFIVDLVYSVILLTAPVTASFILSKPPSSPVTISNNSLDASLAVNAAPAKSPEKNLIAALPNKPNASNPCFSLDVIPSNIALPRFLIDCTGSSKRLLKYPVTVPILLLRKLKKSLNAKLKLSKATLKASVTF